MISKVLPTLIVSAFLSTAPALALETTPQAQEWERTQKAGTEALNSGRYGEAERILQQAVIKSAVFGQSDLRYAKSLDELARLYSIRGRFREAEPLLEESLHAKELTMSKDNGEIIPSLASMIKFYLEHGTASKAPPLAERLLAFIEGELSDYRTSHQGPVTLKKGHPLEGWAGVAAPTMRDPVIEWAISCDAIGNSFRAKGNLDLADRLFKAALDVKETVLGKEHLSLANSFDSIGTICLDKEDNAEAESLFRYALEHTERVIPDEHAVVFNRIDKLAKVLIKEQKYEEAEQLYIRALDFWKTSPSKNGSEARVNYALGSLLVTEQKYEQAAPVLENALTLAEEFYGPDSISLIPYLRRCADAAYHLRDEARRAKLVTRADTISSGTQ